MLWALLIFPIEMLADGFIIIDPPYPLPRPTPTPSFQPFPLDVKNHNVTVNIQDEAAVTDIDQTFYNPTSNSLQGYYIFPIPKGTVIDKFSMFIDGKETEAELLDADKARQIYEDYVRKVIDPALLEYNDQGLLRVRIFPIEPHSEKRIKLSYSEILNKDNHTVEYNYPLNTERFSASPLNELSITVDIHSQGNITNVFSPTHDVEIARKDTGHVVVSYEASDVKPDRDFKLYYNNESPEIGLSLLTYRKGKDDGFFFLSLSPDSDPGQKAVVQKDITFVLDVSGSMSGEKLSQAKKALLFCINNLNRGDRFEIIRFSSQAEALFRQLSYANDLNIERATEYVGNLRAIGGTNIEEALQLALSGENRPERPHFVIFITDGKPTIGEMDENALLNKIKQANLGNMRIFTFGIGEEINTHLLDKITEYTNAYRTYIAPNEDIEVKISNFYNKVSSPVLTNIRIKVDQPVQISELYPRHLPDLFKDASITLLGRYRGSGTTRITVEGTANKEAKTFEYSLNFSERDEKFDFIPTLWASRAIGFMLDQIRLHEDNEELKKGIIELARTYGIITPYTSYLIIEDEAKRVARDELPPRYQLLRQNVINSPEFINETADEYQSLSSKSGKASVSGSEAVQFMSRSANVEQAREYDAGLKYRDSNGREQNLANQYRMVQGRAVYQSGEFWVDSEIQNNPRAKVITIPFASEDYFDLLRQEPGVTPFLALGHNLRFFWDGKIYEIYE